MMQRQMIEMVMVIEMIDGDEERDDWKGSSHSLDTHYGCHCAHPLISTNSGWIVPTLTVDIIISLSADQKKKKKKKKTSGVEALLTLSQLKSSRIRLKQVSLSLKFLPFLSFLFSPMSHEHNLIPVHTDAQRDRLCPFEPHDLHSLQRHWSNGEAGEWSVH